MNPARATFDRDAGEFPDLVKDESRLTGSAGFIAFPRSEEDLRSLLRPAAGSSSACPGPGVSLTVQGARTGITGGAVPRGGNVLNLSRMNRILALRRDPDRDEFLVTVQPGVVLSDLTAALSRAEFDTDGWSPESGESLREMSRRGPYFFAPDPTETTASLGGMAACNASGARAYLYGSTREHVSRARLALAGGHAIELRRGVHRAQGRSFRVAAEGGDSPRFRGRLPSYTMPPVKNAAGYFAKDGMDLLDLFIGSEGTLGVFAELELRLIRRPAAVWGVMAFFPDEQHAVRFVAAIRGSETLREHLAALEFFDCRSLELVRSQKKGNGALEHIPDLRPDWHTAVYFEMHGPDETAVEAALADAALMLERHEAGGDSTWLASDSAEMRKLKDLRHAVPELVNMRIDLKRKAEPGLTKLGTDLAVPDGKLEEVLALYHAGLDRARLEHVMFGHIGNNHIHVNIIPNNMEEYETGKNLYVEWARAVLRMGGTVSAEHGIGKLKTALLVEMYGQDGVREMMDVKRVFDPGFILNRGNLFALE